MYFFDLSQLRPCAQKTVPFYLQKSAVISVLLPLAQNPPFHWLKARCDRRQANATHDHENESHRTIAHCKDCTPKQILNIFVTIFHYWDFYKNYVSQLRGRGISFFNSTFKGSGGFESNSDWKKDSDSGFFAGLGLESTKAGLYPSKWWAWAQTRTWVFKQYSDSSSSLHWSISLSFCSKTYSGVYCNVLSIVQKDTK